jgi:hypothetical protein
MPILDSGNRREFSSGAVRDIAEGKGRCDLMPLDALSIYLTEDGQENQIFKRIDQFIHTGDMKYLSLALDQFCKERGWDKPTMILETSHQFEEGAIKYGEHNWEKGIPLHCYLDSATRHYIKVLRKDTDEPHDRAFCWNIMCAMWTLIHLPDLNDLPFAKK